MKDIPAMSERRVAAFFYGLFMDADLVRAKGAAPEEVQLASVPGFGLRIGQRATLVADPGAIAHGALMWLTLAELDMLYSEETVRMYRPEAVVAHIPSGRTVPALCFNLPEEPSPRESNPEYAAKLRNVARCLKLPVEYIERIG
jgi:hypothetical protein